MNQSERRRAIQRQLFGMEPATPARGALSTGFAAVDAALGGGFPRRAITEIYGPASCGKTAFVLQAIAYGQARGASAVWIDADHAFDPKFAAQLGVDVSQMPVAAPETAEEALDMARRFVSSGAVDLVAIDSAAALVPRLELETAIGRTGAGLQARVLTSEMRRVAQAAARSSAAIVLLNQTRFRPAEPETSSGGPSIKLYAALRIALSASGRRVRFRAVKNKFSSPFGEAVLEWQRGGGFAEPR